MINVRENLQKHPKSHGRLPALYLHGECPAANIYPTVLKGKTKSPKTFVNRGGNKNQETLGLLYQSMKFPRSFRWSKLEVTGEPRAITEQVFKNELIVCFS